MNNPHTSLNKFVTCSGSGKIINYSASYSPPDIKLAYLKHYYFKSFEEFFIKKNRGDGDKNNLNKKLKEIFDSNKNDSNKLEIMKKIFNITALK